MQFQTMSLVTGTRLCNASCPFCVSKMTGMRDIDKKPEEINERNLAKALDLAKNGGVTTAILTGKGEPTLYPEHISQYLSAIHHGPKFPLIELQTNGWFFTQDKFKGEWVETYLNMWASYGLTTVMISNCGYDPELNRRIYFPKQKEYIDLAKVVERCHKFGFNVRLTTVGIEGGIDSPDQLNKLMEFADFIGADQVSWRPVNKAEDSTTENNDVSSWVSQHGLEPYQADFIYQYVDKVGTPLMNLIHGATVYDFKGQNLCMTSCLTHGHDEDKLRQLIFYPNGKLTYDWQYKGAIILRGKDVEQI